MDHPHIRHKDPATTQHYAKINPTTLSKAYTEAGYFARNVRTIEVLIDRDAVISGTAATGQPWQHYDLGHGWCSYSFFEQCQQLDRLVDIPTPAGPTPRQIGAPPTATMLPIVQIHHDNG